MAMQDAQKQEASRSIFKGKYLKKDPNEMVEIAFYSEQEVDQVDWRAAMVEDMVVNTNPP
jgi:hypothetical protein